MGGGPSAKHARTPEIAIIKGNFAWVGWHRNLPAVGRHLKHKAPLQGWEKASLVGTNRTVDQGQIYWTILKEAAQNFSVHFKDSAQIVFFM